MKNDVTKTTNNVQVRNMNMGLTIHLCRGFKCSVIWFFTLAGNYVVRLFNILDLEVPVRYVTKRQQSRR